MLLTTHAVLGAYLAQQLAPTHPIFAFLVGLGSHFLVDMIPHGDSDLYKGYVAGLKVRRAVAYVAVDALIAIGISILLVYSSPSPSHRLILLLGILGGALPDILVAIYQFGRVKSLRWFNQLHFFFHNMISSRKGDVQLWTGVGMQAVILFVLWRWGF